MNLIFEKKTRHPYQSYQTFGGEKRPNSVQLITTLVFMANNT